MDDLEGMINGILSNPEEMKKIMDMAGQIMGNSGANTSAASGSDSSGMPSLEGILSGIGSGNLNGAANLSELASLASAAQKLLGNGTVQKLLSSPIVQNIANEALHPNNDKKALFEALKPWLSEERRRKLDRAIVFARVMRVAGAATPLLRGAGK